MAKLIASKIMRQVQNQQPQKGVCGHVTVFMSEFYLFTRPNFYFADIGSGVGWGEGGWHLIL